MFAERVTGILEKLCVALTAIIGFHGLSYGNDLLTPASDKRPSRAVYADFTGFESANFRVLSTADCNADYVKSEIARKELLEASEFQDFVLPFEWVPSGAPKRLEDRNCEPERLQNLLYSKRSSTRAQASALREFFQTCHRSLRHEMPSGPKAVISMTQTEYRYCEHPNMRKVILKLANGDIVRGILALKPGKTPRPLIIAKCGVICNAGDSAMRFLLMHLFDEAPFNLLVLSNNTGADYVRDNRYFIPGGLREGQHFILAAQLMRSGVLGKRISSVHAVGVSLGAHAALYGAYMSQFQGTRQPVLASALAACPVVDLRSSITDLFQWSIKGTIAQVLFGNAIDKVLETNPELNPLFGWWWAPRTDRPRLIAEASARYLGSLKRGWNLAPFENLKIKTYEDFWTQNQALTLAQKPFLTPTLALAADDDEVVNPDDNTGKLAKTALAATTIPAGDHCAFGQMYGWRISSALYRGFFLSQSPDLLKNRKSYLVSIPLDILQSAGNHSNDLTLELHGVTRYDFTPGVEAIKVIHQYFSSHNDFGCTRENTRFAPAYCYREVSFDLPFSRLPSRPWWAHAPRNASEAESLTRWANINLKAVDHNGVLVDDTGNLAIQLKWLSYDGEF
jgi:hypothetical protein